VRHFNNQRKLAPKAANMPLKGGKQKIPALFDTRCLVLTDARNLGQTGLRSMAFFTQPLQGTSFFHELRGACF